MSGSLQKSAPLALCLLLSGCGSQPDYTPFGDGMKAIGICLVVYGIVNALVALIQGENEKPTPPATRKGRTQRGKDQAGGPAK